MYQARSNGSFVRRTATNSPTFRKRVQDHIVMLLVGREATELLFGGVPASGHKKDYSDARKIIRRWLLPGADTGTCIGHREAAFAIQASPAQEDGVS